MRIHIKRLSTIVCSRSRRPRNPTPLKKRRVRDIQKGQINDLFTYLFIKNDHTKTRFE